MKPGARAAAAPPSPEDLEEILGSVVAREGGGPPGWPRELAAYLGFLLERNAAVNLISRRTAQEIVVRQVLPSLAALRLVPPGSRLRVLDVGSGGGFPGVPLRILRPEIRLDLLDATRKKCRFLEECVSRLGWEDVRVHWGRVETPGDTLTERAPFDLAVARAVGDEERLAGSAAPLLAAGGAAWVFAAPSPGLESFEDAEGMPVTALRRIR